MKSQFRQSFTALTILIGTAGGFICMPTAWAGNTDLPSKSEVLPVMNNVATYARNNYPPDCAKFANGVLHIGNMAFYSVNIDANVLAYTEDYGNYNNWIVCRTANRHNRLAGPQAWISADDVSPVADITDTRAEIADQTSLSLATITNGAYFSVDSQFMALPAFAMLGKRDNNNSYFTRMKDLWNYTKVTLQLYDTTAHLYYRDASYIYPGTQTPNGKKLFWSRGNGWALGALARILTDLPSNDSNRAAYVKTFQELSAALKAVQRSDGFWNMSLYDPNYYPGPETSGTALFAYGMAWGINNGLLSKTTYTPVVAKAWNAMVGTAVHANGQLGYVQPVGEAPVDPSLVTYDSSFDFGVGCFLLAGSEVYKLAQLLGNPNFDAGTASPWVLGKGTSIVTGNARSAPYSAKLTVSASGTNSLSQVVTPATPGKTYTFSGYVKIVNSLPGGTRLKTEFVDDTGSTIKTTVGTLVTSAASYTFQTVSVVAPANTARVRFRILNPANTNTTGISYWDDMIATEQ
jgi:unsaturated rhamnogalacturonyl hydrolase